MLEKDFQSEFSKWVKYNITESSAFELKMCKIKRFPFSNVQQHQKDALLMTENVGIRHKIIDCGYQNPFDFFFLKGKSYIVIMFYKRGQKKFHLIRIKDWLDYESKSLSKSITEEECESISSFSPQLPS